MVSRWDIIYDRLWTLKTQRWEVNNALTNAVAKYLNTANCSCFRMEEPVNLTPEMVMAEFAQIEALPGTASDEKPKKE